MALLERDLDRAVVDSDRRTVGECQIVGPRRQPDVVDDQSAVFFRNHFTDLVFDGLEDRLGSFDAGSGRSANMKLDLAAVDQREEVPADQPQHHPAEPSISTATTGTINRRRSNIARNFEYPSRSRSKPRSNAAVARENKPAGVPSAV